MGSKQGTYVNNNKTQILSGFSTPEFYPLFRDWLFFAHYSFKSISEKLEWL